MDPAIADNAPDPLRWYACYTRGRHEKRVGTLLTDRGFEVFLPTVPRVRQWHDREKVVEFPLFPSYVFARCARTDLARAVTTPGVVSIVQFGGRPVAISDEEVENVRRLAGGLAPGEDPPEVGPMVAEGQEVEIVTGPLSSVRGVVAERRGSRRVLVVGVAAIKQGIRVEVDRAAVRPLEA